MGDDCLEKLVKYALAGGFKALGTECRFPKVDEMIQGMVPELADPLGFQEVHANLPLTWEQSLWQEAISLFYITHRFLLGREHMLIDLEKPLVGNFVCTVLISCENWMDQTWMRGGPNVDINFVYFVGKNISLNDITRDEEVTIEDNEVTAVEAQDAGVEELMTEVVHDQDTEADELVSRFDRIWFGCRN